MFTNRYMQRELVRRGHTIEVDGEIGHDTMAAIDAELGKAGFDIHPWRDDRRVVAFEQLVYRDAGIDVGALDGLVGEQTRFARKVWEARKASGGKPVATVEQFRDHLTTQPGLSGDAGTALLLWPRQKDVAAFFGLHGKNQVLIELPFPMRLADEPIKTINRFSCHSMVRDALGRIWKNTLDHYGYEQLVKMRLDMFGGCFNDRKMRGGSAWSMHAWGIAQDVDPDRNQLHFKREQASLMQPAYDPFWAIVYAEGALSLGKERNYDPMHFQFTRDFS